MFGFLKRSRASRNNDVLLFEYCTALEIGVNEDDDDHGMYREGKAMRDAVLTDFKSSQHVVILAESIEERGKLKYFLIIAPEINDALLNCYEKAKPLSFTMLGPKLSAVKLTSNKLKLAQHWEKHGVKTPMTQAHNSYEPPAISYPAIYKRFDGAGSQFMWLVKTVEDVPPKINFFLPDRIIAQPFVPGRAASIAFLIGPAQTIALRPTFQLLSDDGRFQYLGGQLPISSGLEERAIKLGRQAVDCVPGLAGYIGVDLVLGDAGDGSQDYAIEINPRLTTSYVGLRALADFNIAQAMIDVVEGRPVDYVKWKPGRVQFWPDGRVEYDPAAAAWA